MSSWQRLPPKAEGGERGEDGDGRGGSIDHNGPLPSFPGTLPAGCPKDAPLVSPPRAHGPDSLHLAKLTRSMPMP